MSAHTTGPWMLGSKTTGDPCISTRTTVVCYVTKRWTTTNPEEWKANAHLIAAAPELLDVLRRVSAGITLNGLNAVPDPPARDAFIRLMVDVRLAIANAEGGPR